MLGLYALTYFVRYISLVCLPRLIFFPGYSLTSRISKKKRSTSTLLDSFWYLKYETENFISPSKLNTDQEPMENAIKKKEISPKAGHGERIFSPCFRFCTKMVDGSVGEQTSSRKYEIEILTTSTGTLFFRHWDCFSCFSADNTLIDINSPVSTPVTPADYQPISSCVLEVDLKSRSAATGSVTIMISDPFLQMELAVLLFGYAREFCYARGLQHLSTKQCGGKVDSILQFGGWHECTCQQFSAIGTQLLCDSSWNKGSRDDTAFEEYRMQVLSEDKDRTSCDKEGAAHKKLSETIGAETNGWEDEDLEDLAAKKRSKRSVWEDLDEAVHHKTQKTRKLQGRKSRMTAKNKKVPNRDTPKEPRQSVTRGFLPKAAKVTKRALAIRKPRAKSLKRPKAAKVAKRALAIQKPTGQEP